MKIITKYILKNYILPLILCLICCLLFFIIIDVFRTSKYVIKNHISLIILVKYYYYLTPMFLFRYVTPIASLIAVFICIGSLGSKNEIVAMLACGIKPIFIIRPIIITALLLSLLSLVLGLDYIPDNYHRARFIMNVIKKRSNTKVLHNVQQLINDNIFAGFGTFDFKNEIYTDINVFEKKSNITILDITAQRAEYDKKWIFYDGKYIERNSYNNEIIKSYSFKKKEIDLMVKSPEELYNAFTIEDKVTDELTLKDLLKYSKIRKESGLSHVKTEVDIHYKFSFPFANLIFVILGITISFYSNSHNLPYVLGLSLILCFIYWILFSIGISLGNKAVLSPLISAWVGNLVFIFLIFIIHLRTKIS